jgi:hypothetical protein
MVSVRWTDLFCQRIKLVGKRHAFVARHQELAFANHVQEFNASQESLRRSERFEAGHRPSKAFDSTMILLYDIVEVFDLPDLDGVSRSVFNWSRAALLAPLLSIVTVPGTSLYRIALSKKRLAAEASRLAVNRKSMVLPCLSTVR